MLKNWLKHFHRVTAKSRRDFMSKHICFIRSGSVKTIDNLFHILYEHFSKEFQHIFFVNVSKIFTSKLICDPDDVDAHKVLPADFTYVVPEIEISL